MPTDRTVPEQSYSTAEAAALLGLGDDEIRSRILAGDVAAYNVSRPGSRLATWRILASEIVRIQRGA